MKKLDIINRLTLPKSITTATNKLAIVKELMDIKESFYLGVGEWVYMELSITYSVKAI